MTSAHSLAAALIGALLLAAPSVRAAPPRTAVFAFELDDTSLQGAMRGSDADDQTRLHQLDAQLRAALAQSSRYDVVAVATDPSTPSWWTCDGCEVDSARKAGAAIQSARATTAHGADGCSQRRPAALPVAAPLSIWLTSQ